MHVLSIGTVSRSPGFLLLLAANVGWFSWELRGAQSSRQLQVTLMVISNGATVQCSYICRFDWSAVGSKLMGFEQTTHKPWFANCRYTCLKALDNFRQACLVIAAAPVCTTQTRCWMHSSRFRDLTFASECVCARRGRVG